MIERRRSRARSSTREPSPSSPPSRCDRHRDAPRVARAQGADPAGPDPRSRRTRLPLPPPPDPRRGVRLDTRRQPARSCTSCSPAGSSERTGDGSCVRGDHRLPPRAGVSAIEPSSARSTTRRGRSHGRPPSGSARPATERSPAATRAAAVNLISRAVRCCRRTIRLRVDLVPNVRVVQGLSGDLSWADRVLTEGVAAAAATDDRRLEAHALVQRGFLRLFTQPDVTPQELLEVAERAISVFEELGDELGLARAWRLVAQAHYLDRDMGRSSAEASSTRARACPSRRRPARAAGDRRVALRRADARLDAGAGGCRPLRGLLADVESEPVLEPTVLSVLANVEAMQGQSREADELLERWRHAVDELGDSIWLSRSTSDSSRSRDDPVAAERELRPGYEALKRIGEKSHFSSVTGLLVTRGVRAGSLRGGRAAQPGERAGGSTERHPLPHPLAHHARPGLAQRGELEAARGSRTRSGGVRGGERLPRLARRRTDESRRGAPPRRSSDEAGTALEQAASLYEQKGNIVSAAKARARLESISPV